MLVLEKTADSSENLHTAPWKLCLTFLVWLTTVSLLLHVWVIVGDYPHDASSTYSLLIVSEG